MCILICFVKFFPYHDYLQICSSPVLKSRDVKGRSKFFKVFFFKFDCITRINLIVINMQCLQSVFFSLLSLQKHRVSVKGHQNNLQAKKIYAPASKIPRSAAGWRSVQRAIGWRHGVRLSKASLRISRPIRSSSSFGRLM